MQYYQQTQRKTCIFLLVPGEKHPAKSPRIKATRAKATQFKSHLGQKPPETKYPQYKTPQNNFLLVTNTQIRTHAHTNTAMM